jgi:signal transduction histidine kinase
MLPYLLLDNALKYAPKESDINIEFLESIEFINVEVSSIGPSLKQGEIDHIFEKGFRGHEAKQMVKQGAGRGLAIAKHICDLHKAEIRVENGLDEFTLGGVTHSNFIVKMKFPRH